MFLLPAMIQVLPYLAITTSAITSSDELSLQPINAQTYSDYLADAQVANPFGSFTKVAQINVSADEYHPFASLGASGKPRQFGVPQVSFIEPVMQTLDWADNWDPCEKYAWSEGATPTYPTIPPMMSHVGEFLQKFPQETRAGRDAHKVLDKLVRTTDFFKEYDPCQKQ